MASLTCLLCSYLKDILSSFTCSINSLLNNKNTSQVVPAQSRTRDKTYPDFLTYKSYPVFTEVYHLVPADHQVVPE